MTDNKPTVLIGPKKLVRSKPDYMIKWPDRDYSVNRAERRKKIKKKGKQSRCKKK